MGRGSGRRVHVWEAYQNSKIFKIKAKKNLSVLNREILLGMNLSFNLEILL